MDISGIPNTLTGWLGLTGIIIFGAFGIFGLIDQGLRKHRKDGDEAEDRVITLLKEEVAQLTKKVNDGEAWRKDAELRMERVISENKTLRDVLQGRDKQTLEYKKSGMDAMARVKETHEMVVTMNRNIERLATSIEKFVSGGITTTTKTTEVKSNA